MTKIKKIHFFVDYTTNPINMAVTPSIKIIGNDVYTYDTAFNTYSDSNLLKNNGKMITRSVMYQDPIHKTLTGQSTGNIRISRNGNRIEISKSARILQEYVDNNDPGSFPVNHRITSTRVENIAVEQIFINGNLVYTVWDDIKYNPSKKRYTVRYEERDKN